MNHIQDEEDAGVSACQEAYTLHYRIYPGKADQCEDAEWDCDLCPFTMRGKRNREAEMQDRQACEGYYK